jgi:CelD/BcsL family acetyltransferase involved in cellulose biosynthesis
MLRYRAQVRECLLRDFEWDVFVSGTAQNNVFVKSPWVESICGITGLSHKLIICSKGDEVLGGCVLFLRKRRTGWDVVIPPLTQYTTPCIASRSYVEKFRSEQQVLAVTRAIADYIERRFERAALINHPTLLDIRSFLWSDWTPIVRYTYLLDVSDPKNLQENLSRDVTRQVRKAEKGGFYVKQSPQFEKFASMWKASLSRQSAAMPMGEEDLVRLLCSLREKGSQIKFYFAHNSSGSPVAGSVFLIDQNQAFYWLGGIYPEYLSSGANQLMFWYGLQDLHANGITCVDFVGADHPSIARYKSTYGGRLHPHFAVTKICSNRAKTIEVVRRLVGMRWLLR